MKKIILTTITMLWALSGLLQARTPQEAAQIASQFISQSHIAPTQRMQRAAAATTITTPVELAFTQHQVDNTTPAIYVFRSNKGFVLVSAEDNARAILGYSDDEKFDPNNIPDNMQFWFQVYADEMANKLSPTPSLKGRVTRKASTKAQETYPTVSPILGTVIWGQGEPYNHQCPTINGENAVTGCVATALSQIMYAHKYPTKGTGTKSYTTDTRKLSLSADFGATTYDWANMLPNYNNKYNIIQLNAVATLMYHVGVAVNMDYNTEGSGAVSSIALAAITEYFGYDKGIQVLPKDFMQEEEVLQTIATDLQAGRPVYISGSTVNNEGHAFVCDGMKSDGYLHINWGWNGSGNGYFALSALDPENQGTGGSASDLAFTEHVDVYTNIKPNTGGKAMPLVTVDKLIRTSADTINKSTPVSFSLDQFASNGIATAAGTITYFIYDSNGELTNKVEIKTFELETGYYYPEPYELSQSLPSSLTTGKYELEIRYVDNAGADHPILVERLGKVRLPFTVTNTQFIFGKTPQPDVEPRHFTNADFSVVSGNTTWAVELFSSQFWADTPSDNDILIRCYVHSNNEKSIMGTYTMEAGTIDADALYAEGYHSACYKHTPTALHLTIIPAEGDKVTVQYYIEVNEKTMQGSYTTIPDWYIKDGEDYYFNTDYNYELSAKLTASKALELTRALSHTDLTEISYFVSGTISNIHNTATQIAEYKQACFDISDDGTTNDQFYSHNTKWLNNADFSTGQEISLGDEIVLLGQLQNDNATSPRLVGYVYSCRNTLAGIEEVNIEDYTEIYDIMGRKIDAHTHLSPGVYILQKKNQITKIHINK